MLLLLVGLTLELMLLLLSSQLLLLIKKCIINCGQIAQIVIQ